MRVVEGDDHRDDQRIDYHRTRPWNKGKLIRQKASATFRYFREGCQADLPQKASPAASVSVTLRGTDTRVAKGIMPHIA